MRMLVYGLYDHHPPEEAAQAIQSLIYRLPFPDTVNQELGFGDKGLDIRDTVKRLAKFVHNDDQHHNGEDVLLHIQWVLADLPKVLPEVRTDELQYERLYLVALMHDLGKAFTYEMIDGKHTFRKHAELSVRMTQALLWELRAQEPQEYQQIEDLVRLHDAFMRLTEAQKGAKGTKYLNKFLREPLYQNGHIQDLITFSRADGFRAKRMGDTLDSLKDVLQDIEKVEERKRLQADEAARQEQKAQEHMGEIRALLEAEAPEAAALLPNLREAKKALGFSNLRLIKRIEGILSK